LIAHSRSLDRVRRRVEYAIVASAFSVGFDKLSGLFKAVHGFVHQWRMLDGRNRSTADVRALVTDTSTAARQNFLREPDLSVGVWWRTDRPLLGALME
jgi:hypothetical protein